MHRRTGAHRIIGLKDQLQSHLPDARTVASPKHPAKIAGSEAPGGIRKIRVVERIKELQPELQIDSFSNLEVLHDRGVPSLEPSPRSMFRPSFPRIQVIHDKCVGIKPFFRASDYRSCRHRHDLAAVNRIRCWRVTPRGDCERAPDCITTIPEVSHPPSKACTAPEAEERKRWPCRSAMPRRNHTEPLRVVKARHGAFSRMLLASCTPCPKSLLVSSMDLAFV